MTSTTSIDPIYAPLNEAQKEAVEHTDGPLFILAGAGSGKTRALTHRIARLIRDGVKPWNILAVTFTNKAANEMKERVSNMLHMTEGTVSADGEPTRPAGGERSAKLPTMGTFHSICARILRRDIEHLGRDRSFVIYDTDDQQRLMKTILKEAGIDEKELKAKAVLSHIGRFKCEALSPADAQKQATTSRMQQITDAYKKYQAALLSANAMDFDDLMLETVRLFHECPDVLARYQSTWKYIHIDEYQDTNHAQYLLVTQLAAGHKNLCVIGDPDQSIYAFRGADIRNILEFQKDYKDAKQITLDQNYRSLQPILTASDAVISHNPQRPEKQMWTEKKDGPKVVVQELEDEKNEAREAVKEAQKMEREGTPLRHQVVLYRTNAQSRQFEEACMRAGVPYRILGGMKFYARREIKDVLGYLHVILNPNDTVSLLRIINTPPRRIGTTTMEKLQTYATSTGQTLWETICEIEVVDGIAEATKTKLAEFRQMIEELRTVRQSLTASELTEKVLRRTNFEAFIRDNTEEGEERWGNIQELLSVTKKYDQLSPELSLTSFLEEVALVSEVDKLDADNKDALTLMTLHLCKGLEFEHVMIAGCEEGIFPHSSSMMDQAQLEEERRLMYVGMTRAKTHLKLLCTRSRTLWGDVRSNAPSRFLDDLPDSVTERRSDDVLSAFAWASKRAESGRTIEPFRQEQDIDIEFNQDMDFSDDTQENLDIGTRIEHPSFGKGTITDIRGDIVDIAFDSGGKKTLALSIAPLKII